MALTVRGAGGSAIGSTRAPIAVDVNLGQVEPPPISVSMRLGYEELPSVQVYEFVFPRPAELRLVRRGEDRYIVHVQVTVSGGGPGSAYAITTANGEGEWKVLPAGVYRITCALGIPEEIDVELDIHARPRRWRLQGIADGHGSGLAIPSPSSAQLIAQGADQSLAVPTKPHLQAVGGGVDSSIGELLDLQGVFARCRCISAATSSFLGHIRPMVWVDIYGRPMLEGVQFAIADLPTSEVVSGADWETTIQFRDPQTGALRDLSGMTFTAEIWDLDRLRRYAVPTLTTGNLLAGGLLRATLTAAETLAARWQDGDQVVFDVKVSDVFGGVAYVAQALLTVRWGYSTPPIP